MGGLEVLGGVAGSCDPASADGSDVREASPVDLHGEDTVLDLNPVEAAPVGLVRVAGDDTEEDPGDRGLDPGFEAALAGAELGSGDGGKLCGGVHVPMLCERSSKVNRKSALFVLR